MHSHFLCPRPLSCLPFIQPRMVFLATVLEEERPPLHVLPQPPPTPKPPSPSSLTSSLRSSRSRSHERKTTRFKPLCNKYPLSARQCLRDLLGWWDGTALNGTVHGDKWATSDSEQSSCATTLNGVWYSARCCAEVDIHGVICEKRKRTITAHHPIISPISLSQAFVAIYTHINTQTHAPSHARTHTLTRSHTRTHSHAHARTPSRTRTHSLTRTHTHALTRTHARTKW
jgi:hypothetical protein